MPWALGRTRAQPGGVFVQVAGERFDHAIGHAPVGFADQADQVAIVGDHDDGALEQAQRLGQRLAHFKVEVVGGLIEQQHVGLPPGDQRQRQARAFAAGEPIDRFERAVAGEIPLAEEIAERLGRGVRREVAQVVDRRAPGISDSTVCWAK